MRMRMRDYDWLWLGVGVGARATAGAGTGICLELEPEPEISKKGGSGNPAFYKSFAAAYLRCAENFTSLTLLNKFYI